jgi:DNA-directed RNA polymerase specialized sigma24 family protein
VAARDDGRPWEEGRPPDLPAPYRTTASFLAALRSDDGRALRQLFIFYTPLLRDEARRMGLGPGDRRELVMTVLDDVAMRLCESSKVPKDFTRYLVGAVRNAIRSRVRESKRTAARCEQAYSGHGSSGQRIVAECHSAYGLRAVDGSDTDESSSIGTGIAKLAEFSAQSLSTLDASLIVGIGRFIPLRQLADREGITYGAARVRVHRLRERFRKLAAQHLSTLEPVERRELERFFRRAGFVLDVGDGAD